MTSTHLFTGFPNFLENRLLAEVLERDDDALAVGLVHPNRVEHAQREVERLGPDASERVEILAGDESAMHLGLSSREYRHLRDETTVIHHSPRAKDRQGWTARLRGTQNLLELAGDAKRMERFVHFSSVRVADRSTGRADEGGVAKDRLRNLHDRALAHIEALVRERMKELPVTVFRPSQVIGDSRTGELAHGHLPLEAALRLALPPFRVPLPAPGLGAAPFHAVPADWVASTAARLSEKDGTVGKTFHLVDPNPMPLRWVWDQVAARTGKRSWEPLRAALGLPLLAKLFAEGGPLERWVVYGCKNTLEHLDGEGCPPLYTYLDRLLSWAEDQVRHRRVAQPAAAADPFA
jgi:hypothetical protein